MTGKQYTLDELVDRTGFSKRQIRYYITEKLVPGAGDQRGPNAVYGEDTLRRLESIAVYKDMPVGPTHRAMTLAEYQAEYDVEPHSLEADPLLDGEYRPQTGSPARDAGDPTVYADDTTVHMGRWPRD